MDTTLVILFILMVLSAIMAISYMFNLDSVNKTYITICKLSAIITLALCVIIFIYMAGAGLI